MRTSALTLLVLVASMSATARAATLSISVQLHEDSVQDFGSDGPNPLEQLLGNQNSFELFLEGVSYQQQEDSGFPFNPFDPFGGSTVYNLFATSATIQFSGPNAGYFAESMGCEVVGVHGGGSFMEISDGMFFDSYDLYFVSSPDGCGSGLRMEVSFSPDVMPFLFGDGGSVEVASGGPFGAYPRVWVDQPNFWGVIPGAGLNTIAFSMSDAPAPECDCSGAETQVPEPGSLLVAGLAAVAGAARLRRRAAAP